MLLWNRTYQRAVDLAAAGPAKGLVASQPPGEECEKDPQEHHELGRMIAVKTLEELADCDAICMCLPTSAEVRTCCERLAQVLTQKSVVIIDHTSGDPNEAIRLHQQLLPMIYVDAPVSGGPKGAAAGTLTTMVGHDGSNETINALLYGSHSLPVGSQLYFLSLPFFSHLIVSFLSFSFPRARSLSLVRSLLISLFCGETHRHTHTSEAGHTVGSSGICR